MGSAPRKQSKTYKVPKRPLRAARLDAELKVVSVKYGLGVWQGGYLGWTEECWDGLGCARGCTLFATLDQCWENFGEDREALERGLCETNESYRWTVLTIVARRRVRSPKQARDLANSAHPLEGTFCLHPDDDGR